MKNEEPGLIPHWLIYWWSRGSSVGPGYELGDQGWIPGRGREFFLHHRVQTGSVAHPVSYTMCTGGSFKGDEEAGALSWPFTSIYLRS